MSSRHAAAGAAAGAVACCLIAAPALAANPGGVYVGGGWGQFDLHINNLDDVGQAISSIVHSHDNAWQVFAGYRFNPYIGIEAAYVDLGKPGDQFTATGYGGHYALHLNGFEPSVVGTIPLGPVELFARAGYFYYDVRLDVNSSSLSNAGLESSHTRESFLYGGGLGVTFFDHLNLRAEYDQLDLRNYQSSQAIWLLLAWRF